MVKHGLIRWILLPKFMEQNVKINKENNDMEPSLLLEERYS